MDQVSVLGVVLTFFLITSQKTALTDSVKHY